MVPSLWPERVSRGAGGCQARSACWAAQLIAEASRSAYYTSILERARHSSLPHLVLATSLLESMDSPKSAILIWNERLSRMFSGFTSRWMRPCIHGGGGTELQMARGSRQWPLISL